MSQRCPSPRSACLPWTVLILGILMSCGQARPTPANYLGKWEGTVEALTGGEGRCHLDISPLGQSFLIKSERQLIGNCEAYEGIWTLTPEGNLTGGPMGSMLISYDKTTKKAVVAGLGQLRYLRRPSPQELAVAAFAGTWRGQASYQHFRLEELNQGGFRFSVGAQQQDGRIIWVTTWPVQVQGKVLIVQFGEGSATISKVSNDELLYTQDDASGSKTEKALRVR
ncbi:hypothetical protein ANRL2_01652 [Anaerolineae bacterium]|nr:hypothetical protein ANRL2_01652 [Anaerolineae bacterium]